MLWQEKDENKTYEVPDDIVDVAFRLLNSRSLPLEHAHALSSALHDALPWLGDENDAGVHLIHGAESGNGWMRPEDPENEVLYISRRTRLTLRLPKHRLDDAGQLVGQILDIDGYPVEIGEPSIKKLIVSGTVFSRYVVSDLEESEEDFIERQVRALRNIGIKPKKLLCGRTHTLKMPENDLFTRSVMIADLDNEDAIRLQEQGLGEGRKIGCGIFLAHKGIDAVKVED